MRALLSLSFFLALLPAAALSQQAIRLSVSDRVTHAPIDELSGIVKSPAHEDLYWVHNDSGDSARLFAIDGEGRVVIPTYSRFSFHGEHEEEGKKPWQGFKVLSADNVDWEDITSDGRYLYVADTGNNLNHRRDLAIYMIGEIDPRASTQAAVIRRIPVSYPEQRAFPGLEWHYDSESLFSFEGRLYLITKHRGLRLFGQRWPPGAHLYRLDSDHTGRDNPLTLVGHRPDLTAATGAELSPNGSRLAVVSYSALWLFDRPGEGDQWLSSTHERLPL